MSDYEDYLERTITELETHAADVGHCQEFRDQCRQAVPGMKRELAQIRVKTPRSPRA
jgi:hypothetical protein